MKRAARVCVCVNSKRRNTCPRWPRFRSKAQRNFCCQNNKLQFVSTLLMDSPASAMASGLGSPRPLKRRIGHAAEETHLAGECPHCCSRPFAASRLNLSPNRARLWLSWRIERQPFNRPEWLARRGRPAARSCPRSSLMGEFKRTSGINENSAPRRPAHRSFVRVVK